MEDEPDSVKQSMTVRTRRKLLSLFNIDATLIQSLKVHELQQQPPFTKEAITQLESEEIVVTEKMYCSSCAVSFTDRNAQILHYKLDWHRYNLKLSLAGLPHMEQSTFDEEMRKREMEGAEISSISGSESSDDEVKASKIDCLQLLPDLIPSPDNLDGIRDKTSNHHPKAFFHLPNGDLASVYRTFLAPKHEWESADTGVFACPLQLLQELAKRLPSVKIAVFMTGGGHFAAAVFQGSKVIQHKTFHRYVVRAKQGGNQSTKDASGHAPKSAGASLRRYNEAALAADVKELLGETWASLIADCDSIFIRAPSSFKHIFFSGKPAPLNRTDPRVRSIPFMTRRPTFAEVQRVFNLLTSFELYEEDSVDCLHLGNGGLPKSSPKKWTPNKPAKIKNDSKLEKNPSSTQELSESDVEDGTVDLVTSFETLDTTELKQFDCDMGKGRKRRNRGKKSNLNVSGDFDADESSNKLVKDDTLISSIHASFKNLLLTFARTTDKENFDRTLTNCESAFMDKLSKPEMADEAVMKDTSDAIHVFKKQILNHKIRIGITQQFTTLLHIGAAAAAEARTGHTSEASEGLAFVNHLLMLGCDPAMKNSEGKTVYLATGDKAVRNFLRGFRSQNPDLYDYEAAQIPTPLDPAEASAKAAKTADRKKKMKLQKKERDKDKKEQLAREYALEQEKAAEAKERHEFLALSDREKRALAAEKRLAAQHNRCCLCAQDLTGQVPFEYLDLKFCSPKCLQQHRRTASGM